MEGSLLPLDYIFRTIASDLHKVYHKYPGEFYEYKIHLVVNPFKLISFRAEGDRNEGYLFMSKTNIDVLKAMQGPNKIRNQFDDYLYNSFDDNIYPKRTFEGGTIIITAARIEQDCLMLDFYARYKHKKTCTMKDINGTYDHRSCSEFFVEYECDCFPYCETHAESHCTFCGAKQKKSDSKKRTRENSKDVK